MVLFLLFVKSLFLLRGAVAEGGEVLYAEKVRITG